MHIAKQLFEWCGLPFFWIILLFAIKNNVLKYQFYELFKCIYFNKIIFNRKN